MRDRSQARSVLESRAWRLAYLLTGADPAAAGAVVRSALRAQPDLSRLDPVLVDRLVVMHAREWAGAARSPRRPPARRPRRDPAAPAAMPDAGLPHAARLGFRALVSLPRQQAEAWVLSRLDGLEELRVCRAMDCSRTAAARALAQADAAMAERLGSPDSTTPARPSDAPPVEHVLAAMRAAADAFDPRPAAREARAAAALARRRRAALLAIVIAAVLFGAVVAYLAGLWSLPAP